MKAKILTLYCECGWAIYRHHYPVPILECLNSDCVNFNKKFYPPTFELTEVANTDEANP